MVKATIKAMAPPVLPKRRWLFATFALCSVWVNFFSIVLMIQSKAGGNLSEALGNLSAVIRSRKMMREKVNALSSEAKASSFIIGSLPFAVGFMVFLTTPDYIMELFLTETGHVILALAAAMMGLGITVMRNMINFDM